MGKLATTHHRKTMDEKYDFIDRWLPARYTSSVNLILQEKRRPAEYIRRVKKEKIPDKEIMDALYLIAKLNKLQTET